MILLKNEKLTIRYMKDDDSIKIVDEFKLQGWNKDIETLEKYYKEQILGYRKVLVAEVDDNIAGYVTLLPEAKNGPFANKKIPEIVDFNVFIKYQNKGIGSNLIDIAEKIAKESSNIVSLGVGVHYGYGAAQRMYVKRGYIFDGSGVWYKNKQLEQYANCVNDDDLVLYMSKNLE